MNESIFKATLEWLKGQPFSNVMAFLQWGTIIYATYIGMYVLIPEERKVILEGFGHQEAQQTIQIERIIAGFEKALDRLDDRIDRLHPDDRRNSASYSDGVPNGKD